MTIYTQTIQQISFDNKYTKWYINIVENAQKRASTKRQAIELFGYCEKHHIVPESFYINRKRKGIIGFLEGEPEHCDNYVFLTPREHFLVHMLLPKMIMNQYHAHKISHSLKRMMNKNTKYNNSRTFETARKINSTFHIMKTEENRQLTSINMKHYYSTEEGKEVLREKANKQKTSMVGEGNPAFGKKSGFANKSHSKSHIDKLKNKTGKDHHRTGNSGYTKQYTITTPDNETIQIRNLLEFCETHNIPYLKFYNTIKKNKEFNGWKGVEIINPKAVLIDPEGNINEVYNIKQFCKDNDLYYQCIIHVIHGIKPQHKGWTGYAVNRK